MKKTLMIFIAIVFIFSILYAEEQKGLKISFAEMKREAAEKIRKITEAKKTVEKMIEKAEKEKDLRWKICLDDVMTTITGIIASSKSSEKRMINLGGTEKQSTAESQLVLIRGLADSAEQALAEAYSCERKISTVQAKTRVEVEKDDSLSEDEGVSGSMGVGFTDDFVSSKNKSNLGDSDFADAAGSDESGSPVETPEETGGEADSIAEDDGIASPEIEDVSPTRY
ncbi:MAG: hypothetical protein R6W70_05050 [bacterium]